MHQMPELAGTQRLDGQDVGLASTLQSEPFPLAHTSLSLSSSPGVHKGEHDFPSQTSLNPLGRSQCTGEFSLGSSQYSHCYRLNFPVL